MNPSVFQSNAASFEYGGYGYLTRVVSCNVKQELGSTGVYELNMEILNDDPLFDQIKIGNIIAAYPNMTDDVQAFVIESITKPINNLVSVYATHIAQHRAKLIPVSPVTATDLQDALSKIIANSQETNPFNLHSSRTTAVAFTTDIPRSFRDILGGTEGSLLDVYGGEYIWNNFDIELVNRRGRSSNVKIVYGQSMTEFNLGEEFSFSKTITGILPYWFDEEEGLVTGSIQYSDYVNYYQYRKTVPVDYTDKFESKPTSAQLEAKALEDVQNLGMPLANMKIAFSQFEDHVQGDVRTMQLGDTVQVINSNYNVDATTRIVSMTFNVLNEQYDEIQIGDLQQNINDAINDSVQYVENELNPYMAGRGIEIDDHIITNRFAKLDSPDLDDIFYYFVGTVGSAVNVPSGVVTSGMFASIPGDPNSLGVVLSSTQFFSSFNSTELWMRRYHSSAWHEWLLFSPQLRKGESLTLTGCVFAGYITSSSTELSFEIPLSRRLRDDITTITVNNLVMGIRNVQGGSSLDGSNSLTIINNGTAVSGYTVTTAKVEGGIRLTIKKSSVWKNGNNTATNNAPVCAYIGNTTITFS